MDVCSLCYGRFPECSPTLILTDRAGWTASRAPYLFMAEVVAVMRTVLMDTYSCCTTFSGTWKPHCIIIYGTRGVATALSLTPGPRLCLRLDITGQVAADLYYIQGMALTDHPWTYCYFLWLIPRARVQTSTHHSWPWCYWILLPEPKPPLHSVTPEVLGSFQFLQWIQET